MSLSAKIVAPDEAPALTPFGLQMRVMLSTADTGGKFSAIHCIHRPGEGPPPHRHHAQQEYFLVLSGTYRVRVGEAPERVVGPGTMIFIPENTVHSFSNCGETDAVMIDWSIPGGQDAYFQQIDALQAGAGFSGDAIAAVNREHATEFLGH
ncbi:MAG TPA: cupin domain-containing protein [Rhodopila sp.]|nr:cupin domain-containing protein [Rhodopila sp.]